MQCCTALNGSIQGAGMQWARTLISSGGVSWPGGVCYFCFLQFLVVSLRFHPVSSLFSEWKCTVLYKFFNTQVPSVSTEKLVLPRHTRCVLSHLRCSLLLNSYLSRIGRIELFSIKDC